MHVSIADVSPMPFRRALCALLPIALAACASTSVDRPVQVSVSPAAATTPPSGAFDIDWKQRLDPPYVFLEVVGDYRDARRQLATLAQQAAAQGVRPSGPPFGLFYDDPARVPVEFCRARICWPVASTTSVAGPLGYDVLPSQVVLYGFARGRYADLEQAYGGMFEELRQKSWVLDGPIREIYHTDPGTVRGPEELMAELQMPWRAL